MIELVDPLVTISTHTACCVAGISGRSTPVSGAYPTANKALFFPFRIGRPFSVVSAFWLNGATVSGNVDVGIYSTDGVRLASVGSTAQTGTAAVQVAALAVVVDAGLYYVAIACDNTTATFSRINAGASNQKVGGAAEATSAFVLPATVTLATITTTFLPSFGLSSRSAV